MLGDADAVGAWRVDDQHAATAGGRDIYIVDPGAGATDNAKTAGSREQIFRDLRRAANQQSVGIRQIVCQIGGRPPGSGIDLPALGAEQLQRRLRQIVGNDDLQCDLAGLGPRVLK